MKVPTSLAMRLHSTTLPSAAVPSPVFALKACKDGPVTPTRAPFTAEPMQNIRVCCKAPFMLSDKLFLIDVYFSRGDEEEADDAFFGELTIGSWPHCRLGEEPLTRLALGL